jgi:hypothetical protein
MSALAEFRIIETNKLDELKEKSEVKTVNKGLLRKKRLTNFGLFLILTQKDKRILIGQAMYSAIC